VVWGLLLGSSTAFAVPEDPVVVRADQVEYLDQLGKVVAVGNVEATYEKMKLTCDQATIYMETKDAYLTGRVHLYQPGGLLKGEEVVYNFETRKGTILRAEGEAGPWRTHSKTGSQVSKTAFLSKHGYITTCDFEKPHTRLQAREVRVFLGDKVVLKHAVGYLGNIPLLYMPSYTHPLDDKRPRVTIIPGKDKEWGLYLLTAWRVYLHENLQGRFHMDYRERLDLATGLDLKYRLPVGGEGIFREYYTHERALQRDHFYKKWTAADKDHPTAERERYRVQLRHVWQMDDVTRATLEFNRTKDKDVVKDFFLREFEENTSDPTTYFQIIRSMSRYGLSFLITKRTNRFETVTQDLPAIGLNIRPIPVPWLPSFGPKDQSVDSVTPEGSRTLEAFSEQKKTATQSRSSIRSTGWYYQSSWDYAHTNVGDSTEGTRDSLWYFDTVQEIFYPMRLMRWLNFRPFFAFQHSAFSRGLVEDAPQFRQAASTGFDMSTKFFRVFALNTDFLGMAIQKLRHVITPTLQYEYQAKPTLSADRFLRPDGLTKDNVLTVGLEQKLQTKRDVGGAIRNVDLARFLLEWPYDFEGDSGRGGRLRNLTMDLELLPYPWMRIESDADFNPHIGLFETINADIIAVPGLTQRFGGRSISQTYDRITGENMEEPWAVGVGWRYQRDTSSQLTFETEFDLSPKWRLGLYQAFDVKKVTDETNMTGSRTVKRINDIPEQEFRLRRDLHEWTVELIYSIQREQGEAVMLLFRLKAMPESPLEVERSYHRPKGGRNFPTG